MKKMTMKEKNALREKLYQAVTNAMDEVLRDEFGAHVVERTTEGLGVSLPTIDAVVKVVLKNARIDFDEEYEILAERAQAEADRKAKREEKARAKAEKEAEAKAKAEAEEKAAN